MRPVEPKKVFAPSIVTWTLFKTWALTCGSCGRDFVRFAFFGHPKCPWCERRNCVHDQFNGYY